MTYTIDLTNILMAIISLVSVLITGFVIPWLKSKTTEEQQEILSALSKTAVFAAQQLLDDNTSKKEYALKYIESALSAKGITFDTETISGAIEAALKEAKISVTNW